MSAPELKPCPFCGGKAHMTREVCLDGTGVFNFIRCGQCGAKSPGKYHSAGNDCPQFYAEVRDLWNARVPQLEALVLAAEELAEAASEYIANLTEGEFVSTTREQRYEAALTAYRKAKEEAQ